MAINPEPILAADETEVHGYAAHKLRKRIAYIAVQRALYNGFLVRKPCEVCGAARNDDGTVIEAHHDDYDRALEVRWLCKNHHQQWHRENGREYYDSNSGRNFIVVNDFPPQAFNALVATGPQVRAARSLLGWPQTELAKKAGVGLGTVQRMEGSKGAVASRVNNVIRVLTVLEENGVQFLSNAQTGVTIKTLK